MTLLFRQLTDQRHVKYLFAEIIDEVVLTRPIERPPFERSIFDVERSDKINIPIAKFSGLTAIQLIPLDLSSTRLQQILAYPPCFRSEERRVGKERRASQSQRIE